MKLAALSEIRMGYAFRSRLEHDPEGGVSVIQMKDIDESSLIHIEDATKVSLPRGKAHHQVEVGDLIFRSRGRSNTAALVSAPLGDAVVAAPMLLIRPRAVLPNYLHWFINLPSTQDRLRAMAEGTSVQMISAEALRDFEVPVPSPECQQRIVEMAGLVQQEQSLMEEIAHQRKRLMEGILMRCARNTR